MTRSFLITIMLVAAVCGAAAAGDGIQLRGIAPTAPSPEPGSAALLGFEITAPWMTGKLFMRFPEVLASARGVHFIDHYREDMPQLGPLETPPVWGGNRLTGSIAVRGRTAEGLRFYGYARPVPDGVVMEFRVENRSRETMADVNTQMCLSLDGSPDFGGKGSLRDVRVWSGGRLRSLAELAGRPGEEGRAPWVVVRTREAAAVYTGPMVHPDGWRMARAVADRSLILRSSSDRRRLVAITWDTPAALLMSNSGIPCLHAGPGGAVTLKPGEQHTWKGRIYLMENRPDRLLQKWEEDFGPRGRLTSYAAALAKAMRRPRVILNPSNQYANRIRGEGGEELYNEGLNMWHYAVAAQKYLREDGRVEAFITRNTQTQVTTLRYEAMLANALRGDLLIALHSDATGNNTPGGGTWTFYTGPKHLSEEELASLPYPLEDSRRLAALVQEKALAAIREVYPDVLDRGIREHWSRLYMIHRPRCPSCLIEVLFHTNPVERELLKDPAFQDRVGRAIAEAALEFLFPSKR
ncbi:MAG: N-acetylmuramoyl-L-alanine amidase family protein [Armatimonadota bacterium]